MKRRGVKKRIRAVVERRDNYRCKYCGRPATTLDHVIALKHGGKSTADNLVACCEECNSAKGHMSKREWEKRLAEYLTPNQVLTAEPRPEPRRPA